MVAAEFKNTGSTVRIHDEFCEMAVESCILHLGRIVSESYKRRQLSNQVKVTETAVANISVNIQES